MKKSLLILTNLTRGNKSISIFFFWLFLLFRDLFSFQENEQFKYLISIKKKKKNTGTLDILAVTQHEIFSQALKKIVIYCLFNASFMLMHE